ncbi:hypothetical protein AGMMS50276_12210 [Synergistales bacterium]|nr:hypothetical protein AGMMS50276_12210 [Synergistales bacterium]
MIDINNISKRYNNTIALNSVSFTIPNGSVFGFLGPNGAGKTTLIRILTGIIIPDSGQVLINGQTINKLSVKRIGYLPEERGLYKKMKVGEQTIYLAVMKGLSHQEAEKRIKRWFEKLNIMDWWNKKVDTLSKGMQQKIQFIISVIHKPDLLILDEPFSGLDPINRDVLGNEILELNKAGTTIIPAFLFFFIGGYLLYSSVFAAIAATANHSDEIQQVTTIVTLPLILSVIVLSNTINSPDSALSYWFSIIPFTSPVVMMGRIVYGAPIQDVLLSMFLLATTVVLIIGLSGKVYKMAVLYTGKKVTGKEIISWIRNINN